MRFLTTRARRAAAVLLALCAALLVSSCLIYEETLVFDASGGGTLDLTCGLDLSALEALGRMGGRRDQDDSTNEGDGLMGPGMMGVDESEDTCGREGWLAAPGGATVEDLTQTADGTPVRGIRVRVPFAPGQLNALSAHARGASGGENDGPAAELSLASAGGVFTLTGTIPPLLTDEEDGGMFAAEILASARRSLTVTVPGQVLAADADARDGQTYTWRQDPTSTLPRQVTLMWNPAGQSSASAAPITPTPRAQPTRTPAPTRTPVPTATPRPTQGAAQARLTTAVRVYGQHGSFTTNDGSPGGVSAASLEYPFAVAADRSGGLHVADPERYRVLYYPAGSTTATRVYGQPDLNTGSRRNGTAITADGPIFPYGLAVSAGGDLYVSDANNHRVLFYPAGQTTPTRVYGQHGSFTSGTANYGGVSAGSLNAPEGLAVDSSGGLYVADTDNARVLYFPPGSTTATRVYGQQDSFSTNSPDRGGITARSLSSPTGLALDAAGGLYVADAANARVLHFPPGQTTATRVYGQLGDFTAGESNKGSFTPTADTLALPRGVAVDGAGGLYVADVGNERVLYYPAGGTTAARVYGQGGDFTSDEANKEGITAASLNEPTGVAVDPAGNVYVADALNSRVLMFPVG